MPTARARTLFVAAVVFYLFANQTQVGWLYVISALLIGLVVAAWWLNRGVLKGIAAEWEDPSIPRPLSPTQAGGKGGKTAQSLDLSGGERYEGDNIEVGLTVVKTKAPGTAQVRIEARCPLVEPGTPGSAQQPIKLFIPTLPSWQRLSYRLPVTIYRRGLYEFPPVKIACHAPFGFFAQRSEVPSSARILVYPEVRTLPSLDLLDRRLAPQMPRQKAGNGYEALGVRPYRTGDSPRHIHWRSVARHGQLISKEFADETQPGLTLVLDLFQHPYPETPDKHTPFEWAIKCAASLGRYALDHNYPLHLLTDSDVLGLPPMPIGRSALLQFLARVEPTGKRQIATLITGQSTQAFMAVVLPWPDLTVVDALVELQGRRTELLCIVLDPESFPCKGPSGKPLFETLRGAGIDARLVQFDSPFGADWTGQIAGDSIPSQQVRVQA